MKRKSLSHNLLLGGLMLGLVGLILLLKVTPAATTPLVLSDWEGTSPGIRLSTTNNNKAIAPVIAYSPDGSTLAVAYLHNIGSFSTPYIRISTNDGASWSTPTRVVPGSTINSTSIDVSVDGNNKIHLVWTENISLGQQTILHYANNVSGSWVTQQLSQATAVTAAMVEPRILANSNNRLDVVWGQVFPDTQPQLNIMHKRSNNGGSSWGSTNPVAITAPNSFNPALTLTTDGAIHVVWEEAIIEPPNVEFTRLRYARGTGTGLTPSWAFNPADPINIADPDVDQAARPAIVALGNTLYVAYNNRDGGEDLQEVYLTSCSTNCTSQASWVSHPNNPISGGPIGANTQDPFFVIPTMTTYDSCVAVYYHGLDLEPNHELEVVFGVNSCTGWGGNIDQATDFNVRTTNPRISSDGEWLQLVFELRDPDTGDVQVYYRRREIPRPGVFLPFIRRS
ncbi:MAG: exo-alpha-sialidase [Chloroflexi bacterium]|nr:exo-alpha-sialidase [Chloroflexota bacterium]